MHDCQLEEFYSTNQTQARTSSLPLYWFRALTAASFIAALAPWIFEITIMNQCSGAPQSYEKCQTFCPQVFRPPNSKICSNFEPNRPLSGNTQVSQYQKDKTNLGLLKQVSMASARPYASLHLTPVSGAQTDNHASPNQLLSSECQAHCYIQKDYLTCHASCLPMFLARDVIYIYCAFATMSVSVCLYVTEVHWRIIANLGFKFRSQFTAHCGRGACGREGRDHCREEWRDHLALC